MPLMNDPQPSAASPGPPPPPGSVAAIVVAAGRGRRFGGGDNKVLATLGDRPIWRHAVEALRQCEAIGELVLVIRPEDRDAFSEPAAQIGLRLVNGGQQRCDSVQAGLAELDRAIQAGQIGTVPQWVAVHDAARPLVSGADIAAVIAAATKCGAAILATPIRGTIKRQSRTADNSIQTVDRSDLWEALTPQVFRLDILQAAYARWRGRPVTDDAEMVERSGFPVTLVPGSAENLKITQSEDLTLAQAILSRRSPPSSNHLPPLS